MVITNISDAKTSLSKLIELVMQGQEVIIGIACISLRISASPRLRVKDGGYSNGFSAYPVSSRRTLRNSGFSRSSLTTSAQIHPIRVIRVLCRSSFGRDLNGHIGSSR